MEKRYVKCSFCEEIFPENEILYRRDSSPYGDELQCPKCGEVEPGFSYWEMVLPESGGKS